MRTPARSLAALASLLVAALALSNSPFEETATIPFVHQGSPTASKFLPESMGGGVALFDFDGDGLLDVYLTNGAAITDSTRDWPLKSHERFANRLYRNLGDRRFSDVTASSGLEGKRYSTGVAAADYDNDGHTDLFVAGLGGNTLYRNNGDGTFADVTIAAGVQGGGWTTSAGWADLDGDGLLDLVAVRYLDWTFANNPWCGTAALRSYCHPREFPPATHLVYRNLGSGRFRDVTEEWGFRKAPGKGLGIAFADFDGDGELDIAIANDSFPQQVFFRRNGVFRDEAVHRGAAFDDDGQAFSGMGIDAGDYDGDGRFDLIVNGLATERYALFRNTGDGFEYATPKSGLGSITRTNSGWGMRFLDFDNDGDLDLFAAQGHVMDTIEITNPQLRYREPPLLARNDGGRFVRMEPLAGSALGRAYAARGAAFGDLDNDGGIDVVMNCLNGPAVILFNTANRGNYLTLRLQGTRSNRDGLGALVRMRSAGRTQVAIATQAASYQASNDRRVRFGLGSASSAEEIEIRWPSGVRQLLRGVAANRIVEVTEPEEPPPPRRSPHAP